MKDGAIGVLVLETRIDQFQKIKGVKDLVEIFPDVLVRIQEVAGMEAGKPWPFTSGKGQVITKGGSQLSKMSVLKQIKTVHNEAHLPIFFSKKGNDGVRLPDSLFLENNGLRMTDLHVFSGPAVS